MVLLPFPVVGELRIEPHREHPAGNLERFFDGGTQILQQSVIHIPDRQELQEFHSVNQARELIASQPESSSSRIS